ncbi:MAG: hypothetical protein SFV15_11625 [Polyangiaceae bacterium]|nr:hypothetical protein [Polyangiaceae bacterium]
MKRHWLGVVLLFVAVTMAFAVAIALGFPLVAYAALVVGLVITVLLCVAWMRPQGGSPEHHPPVDRVFDDTNP